MAYLHCGRCGLQIKIQGTSMRIDHCPRCLARSATVSPLVQSPDWISPAGGWGAGRSVRPSDARDRRT